MELIDKLVAVAEGFGLEKIVEWRPDFGNALEAFHLDEESPFEEDAGEDAATDIGEDIRDVLRRHKALTALLNDHMPDILWLYDQLERIGFEAEAKR